MARIPLALLVLGLFALAGATRGAPGQRRARLLLQTETSTAAGGTENTQPGASNSSTTPGSAGTIANATSTDSLFEALLRPSVTTIRLLGEVIVDPVRARAMVAASLGLQASALNLTRDVTILGVPGNLSIATVDFNFTARLVRIAPGITLNFLRIRVRGLFERLDTAPILFTNDTAGAVRFTNTILQRTACLPPSQQLVNLINANKAAGTSGGGIGGGGSAAASLIGGTTTTDAKSSSSPNPSTSTSTNTLDIAPAYVYDQPFCVSTLTDVGLDPLAVDDCFNGPLVLQEITITVSSSGAKRDPSTGASPDPGLPSAEGGTAGGGTGGGGVDGDSGLLPSGGGPGPSLTLSFNNTMILCDVFVGPTCAQQTGDALAACIKELLDRRNARMPSPPPASWPPPASQGPTPSPSPSPRPPVQSPGPSSPSGVPLVPVLVPALVGSVALAVVVLGGIVFWRRRQRRAGSGTGGKSGLDSQDSDAQQVLALQAGGDGGGGGAGGAGAGGKGAGGAAAAAATAKGAAAKGKPPASTSAFGSDTNTLGSGTASGLTSNLTYGSSTMTGLTGLTASLGASPPDSANTDPTKSIVLHHMLGAGSFGRVYYGTWQGVGVAVKIIPHSEQANSKVQQEVALCIKFNHPNVVRSLHCVTFEASEQQQAAHMQDSLRSASTLAGAGAGLGAGGGAPLAAGGGAAVPAGAHTPALNMETWIVLEYCNAGSLASRLNMKAAVMGTTGLGLLSGSLALAQDSALSGGAGGMGGANASLTSPADSVALSTALQREQQKDAALAHMRGVLSVARDIAAGMAYLHSLNVCHGDLKCENVLLCYKGGMDRASTGGVGASGSVRTMVGAASTSGPQTGAAAAALAGPSSTSLVGGGGGAQRDRVPFVAKVADFGLSKTFSEASTHMSTATVGTVTHMCPVLLLTGQMRPSCDVFSFGIMLWQMATGGVPFAGMRYAEIVYKVAVAGLRPEFPAHTPARFAALAESCWAADPTARPSFDALVGRLSELLEVADELQAEHEAALLAARESVARPEDVTLAATTSEADARVASQWAAAAAAALLE